MKLQVYAVSAIFFCAALCLAQNASAPAAGAASELRTPSESAPAANPPSTSKIPAGSPATPPAAHPLEPAAGKAAAGADPSAKVPDTPAEKPDDKTTRYVLGPLDEISIRVWENPNLSGVYSIGPDGFMNMALISPTKADGMTLAQLTDTIRTKLLQCCMESPPEVNIELVRMNSKKYYILGEGAARPGEFPLTGPTTVSEALAISGGFGTFANTKKIYVLRGDKKFPFNYKDVINGKHLEQDIQIQNGDKIVIPQ